MYTADGISIALMVFINFLSNVVFSIVMITLGITMLGFGNFSKLQMLGNKMGTGKPSVRNTFLMGAGAGLVAAPCTGPILAALLAYTAKSGNVFQSSFLMFIYSFGFGIPYILLGGAAAKVSQKRVPHQVQVGVKLLFASIMFGLGLYYLRIPFYGLFKEMTPYWPTIASAGLLLGLVMGAIWIMSSRLQNNKVSTLAPTIVLSLGIFGASQWITKPAAPTAELTVNWIKVEQEALAKAKELGRPILVDMWADIHYFELNL